MQCNYLALDRFVAYMLAQMLEISLVFSQNDPENRLKNVPKTQLLFYLNLLLSPEKGKMLLQLER